MILQIIITLAAPINECKAQLRSLYASEHPIIATSSYPRHDNATGTAAIEGLCGD
jgi:hypothetical protein